MAQGFSRESLQRFALRIPGTSASGQPNYVNEDQFKEYWTNVFRSDPQMQAIFNNAKASGGSEKSQEAAATKRARELGFTPPNGQWSLDFDPSGYRVERKSAINRHKLEIMLAAGALGGPIAYGALAGAGAAGAGGAGATGAGAAGAGGAGAAGAGAGAAGAGAAGTGAAAGTTAAAGGSGVVGKLLSGLKTAQPYLSAGAQAAGAASAARAQSRAEEGNAAIDQYGLEKAAYQDAIRNALRGSLLQNLQDVNITPPPGVQMGTVTGGLRPSAVANRGDVGKSLEADALKTVMNGSPAVPHIPAASGIDSGLNLAAIIAAAASAAGTKLPPQPMGPPQPMPLPQPQTGSQNLVRPGTTAMNGARYY